MITRFAPSPTGENIHIGNLRIAVLNHYHAKRTGGKFIMRIEDTKNDRVINDSDERILNCMHKMGLYYDDLIYQSSNKDYHMRVADYMLKKGLAFKRDGAVWVAAGESYFIDGVYGRKDGKFDDFVIIRSNGEPSFIFANIMDDLSLIEQYGDLTVIRGNDHFDNTLKQVHICDILERRAPSYYSVSMVHGVDGKPLSKRDRASNADLLLNIGIHSEALYDYLLHLGNGDCLDRMLKSPVTVDMKKILSMNKKYMTEDFVLSKAPYAEKYYRFIGEHIRSLEDLDMFKYLWERPALYAPFKDIIIDVPFSTFNRESAQTIIDTLMEKTGLTKRELYAELRHCLCGSDYSLDLALVMEAIGVEECIIRGLNLVNKEDGDVSDI